MLAAATAWRILEAEHDQLRQLLDAITRSLDGDAWKHRGPPLDALCEQISRFQDFETETHRPKGVVLLGSVRGRLAEADRLLDDIEDDSRQGEQLLNQAVALIERLQDGSDADAGEIASLLRQHRELMTRQLDQEDSALRSYTSQLLTPQEWSSVVSSISHEVEKVKARRARTRS